MSSDVLIRGVVRTDLMRGEITLLKILYGRDDSIGRTVLTKVYAEELIPARAESREAFSGLSQGESTRQVW